MKTQPIKLKNITTRITKGTTPTTMGFDFIDYGINFIKAEALNGDSELDMQSFSYINDVAHNKLKRSILQKNDVLVTIAGVNIGKVGIVKQKHLPANTNQAVGIVRIKPDLANSTYIYYWFKNPLTFNHLQNINAQAAQPNINLEMLGDLSLLLPDIQTQQGIASAITAYDELINNNRRRIQLLEEAARHLFREWFVYFKFPNHEKMKMVDGVPEGWEKEKLIKIGYLNYGKALVEEIREEGDVKVYGSSGVVGVHSKSLVQGPGIIVGRKGNLGAIHWVNDSYWPIDTVYYIKREQSNLFLYLSLKTIGFINTDASVPGLNRDYAHNKTILVPTKDLLDKFLNQVNDIYSMVKVLTIQNQKLAQARDLLLPRLMSGAIEV